MSLGFGTAGMRAPVGPAETQMNVRQVTRITAGVAAWFAKQAAQQPPHHEPDMFDAAGGIGTAYHEDDQALRIVVGYDARYGSHAFATTAAEVCTAAGFEVFLMPTPTPTPLVPWLIKQWGLDGGIQITASHNPAPDNGYKVYMRNGRLLSAEGAEEIELLISMVDDPVSIPRVFVRPSQDMLRRYVDDITKLVSPGQADLLRVNDERANLKIAITAMHGVGGRALMQSLQAAGFADVSPVLEQQYPDPTFPTVDYPNPEEPAAVARLLEHGAAIQADLLLALDPDADRCAVGIRLADGTYRMLRGDETGPLLATRLITSTPATIATSVVSSQLIEAIAQDRGWSLIHTQTGFKNLMAAAGDKPVDYAFEEAVGIAPAPGLIEDKDGIATALFAATWAAELKVKGLNFQDVLNELYRTYGIFVGTQIAVRTASPTQLMEAWQAQSERCFAGVSGHSKPLASVTGIDDLVGDVWYGQDGQSRIRVITRPSGTESKMKIYVEISGSEKAEQARELLTRVEEDIVQQVSQL